MVPRVRVVGIPVNADAARVREIVLENHHTRYPIYDGDLDHIVGMLHVKDLLRRILANAPISGGTVKPMPVVPETAALDAVLETMQRTQAHLAVVVDEHGGTAGVLSLEDLFEEVVGEIDEGVPEEPSLVTETSTSAVVAGTLRLDELGSALRSRSVARGRGQRERPRACAARPAAACGRRGGVRPHPAGSDVHERTRRAAGTRDIAAGGAGMMRGLAALAMAAGFCAAASLAAQRPAPALGIRSGHVRHVRAAAGRSVSLRERPLDGHHADS